MTPASSSSPSTSHLFEDITTLSDLAERLSRWTSFTDPQIYDKGGLAVGAVLDNLTAHALPVDIEVMGERLTQDQAELVLRLAEALQRNLEAWHEGPSS